MTSYSFTLILFVDPCWVCVIIFAWLDLVNVLRWACGGLQGGSTWIILRMEIYIKM
jgi:hypothetical protein